MNLFMVLFGLSVLLIFFGGVTIVMVEDVGWRGAVLTWTATLIVTGGAIMFATGISGLV